MPLAALSRRPVYDDAFYAARDAATRGAARKMLSLLFGRVEIDSVCDVGCGVGTWLSVAGALGAGRVRGFEGAWVKDKPLAVDADRLTFQDLAAPLAGEEAFDLAVCLEVAEHLPESRAESFVRELTARAPMILFGAAVPGQGGQGHVNEQPQSYWAALFEARGYDAYDPLRPALWRDDEVPWWYRQNALVYAEAGSDAARALAGTEPALLDVVHPAMFDYAEAHVAGRTLKRLVKRAG